MKRGNRFSIRIGLTVAISLLLLVLALRDLDFGLLGRAMLGANYWYVVAAVLLYFVDIGLRAARWQILLRAARPIPTRRLYPVLTIGYMANNLLPARIGELTRAYLVGRRENVSTSTVLASVAIERVIDGVTVLAVLVLTLPALPAASWLGSLARIAEGTFGIAVVICFLLVAARQTWLRFAASALRVLPGAVSDHVITLLARFIEGFSVLADLRRLTETLALSAVIWMTGAITYVLIAGAFGIKLPLVGALAAICVVNLATAVPLAPAGLGAFEVAALAVFGLLGLPAATAAGVTIVLHAVLFLPVVVVGLAFLWRLNLSLGALWSDARRREPAATWDPAAGVTARTLPP